MITLVWLVAVLSLWLAPPTAAVDRLAVAQLGSGLEVTADAGWAGDTIAVRIDHRGYSSTSRVLGMQIDLWMPEGIHLIQRPYGDPGCGLWEEYWGDLDDAGQSYRFGSAFLPDGCDPNADCSGVRLIAAADWHLDSSLQLVCWARIDNDLPPGSYPLRVENLYLASEPPSDRLEMSVADIHVLGAYPPPLPGGGWQVGGPPPQLLLRGVPTETGLEDVVEVQFYLEGSGVAPFRGELIATIDAELPMRPIVVDHALAGCDRDWGLSRDGDFELLPPGCAVEGKCQTVKVRIDVNVGDVGFDSGNPPRWYFRPDVPLFHCDFYFDADTFDIGYTLRVRDVAFETHSVAAEDIIVAGAPPTATPTALPTATATPTPLIAARPCVATEPGVAIVCVEDIEADAGDEIEITVRFRSAGAEHAGLEFVIAAAAPVAHSTDTHVQDDVPWSNAACWANVEIGREMTAFARWGNSVKTLVFSFVDLSPIPDDVHLVTCAASIDPMATPGEYEIHLLEAGGANPEGEPLQLATRSGVVRVRGFVIATAVATATPAGTPPPDDSEPIQQSAPAQHDSHRFLDSGNSASGCQVGVTHDRDWQGILVALTGLMIWSRRRYRRPVAPERGEDTGSDSRRSS